MMLAMQQVQLADWLEADMATRPEVVMAEVETLIRRTFCTPAWRDANPAEGDSR